jgi:hypothetical protein
VKYHGKYLFATTKGKMDRYLFDGEQTKESLFDSIPGWTAIDDFIIDESGEFVACVNHGKKNIFVKSLHTQSPGFFLTDHRKGVYSLTSRQGLLVSGGLDNRIVLWDVKRKLKTGELLGHNSTVNCLKFNADGTLLVSGSTDKMVKLWDVEKKTQISTLRGHSNAVLSLDIDPTDRFLVSSAGHHQGFGESEIMLWDLKSKKEKWSIMGNDGYTSKVKFVGKYIVSIGNDPVVRMFDLENGALKLSFVPFDTLNFILYASDNYYVSTKESNLLIHFVKGLKVYSFENFDLKFNRPDIILKRTGSTNQQILDGYRKMYLKRLKRAGFQEKDLFTEMQTPQVAILNERDIDFLQATNQLSVRVNLKDDNHLLKYLNVFVNSVPLYGSMGIALEKESGRSYTTTITIPLNSGRNKIEISATNEKGVESNKELLEVLYADDSKPDLYLIPVCVEQYADSLMNLTYPVKDGNDMISLFRKSNLFANVYATPLFNNQVTRSDFLALKKAVAKSKPNDVVILFMAGHGLLDANFDFNFVTYNVDMARLGETAISFEDVTSVFDNVPARKRLVLIDACHSGEIDKDAIEEKAMEIVRDSKRVIKVQNFDNIKKNVLNFYNVSNTAVEMMEQMFSDLETGSGAYVIAAAAGNGYAFESDVWSNGVFTYSLLHGLANNDADLNGDNAITVSEMKNFLIKNVVQLTNGRQKPTCRNENHDFDFTLWQR